MSKVVVLDNMFAGDTFRKLTQNHMEIYSIYTDVPIPDLSHGTKTAAILSEFSVFDSIYGVSLSNAAGEIHTEAFIKGLEWCIGKGFDAICMSVGITDYIEMRLFAPLIRKLTDSGTVIVAAVSNSGMVTYPACLPEVIAVECTDNLSGGGFSICKTAYGDISIQSSMPNSAVLEKLHRGFGYMSQPSNSLVTPYIAGLVSRYLSSGDAGNSKESIIKRLRTNHAFVERLPHVAIGASNSIPAIGIIGDIGFALDVQRHILNDDYLAALLTTHMKSDLYQNVFGVEMNILKEGIGIYSSILKADLLLLHDDNINNDIEECADIVIYEHMGFEQCLERIYKL